MALLETKQNTWTTIRSSATADNGGVELAVTLRKWANLPSTPVKYPVSEASNGICFRIRGSTDADTGTYYLYGIRENDDAELACYGTFVIGTMAATMGTLYADTIVITADRWNTTVKTTNAAGNNEMAKLLLDTCGVKYWLMLVTVISAGTIAVDATSW